MSGLTTALDVIGLGLVVTGLAMLSLPIGIIAAGAAVMFVSFTIGGK